MPAAPKTSSRRYWLRVVPLLAVLVTAVHVPSFLRAVWNPDEGFLAVQARMLAGGGVLYDTVVDRKPPLLPWFYQGALHLFGDGTIGAVRVAALLAHLLTAVLLAGIARCRWGERAGAAAGAAYALLSIGLAPEDTQAATFEVFMLPWTAAAFLAAGSRRFGLAGLAVAGAALTKQTGGVALLPVLWLLWREDPAPRRWSALRLAAGVLLPVLAVAVGTGPRRFLFWTVTGSGTYASPEGAWLVALWRGLGNSGILAAAAAGLLAPAVYRLVRRRPVAEADLSVWLAASAVGVVFGLQFYGHYFLQLLPPLVLVGVAGLRRAPRWRPVALTWTALAAAAFLVWGVLAPRTELDHSRAVAAAVRAHTRLGDTVLVWGMHPESYWLAGRVPASRYLTAGFLTNFSGGRGGARVGEAYAVPGAWRTFGREMAEHPPALVVDDARGAPYRPDRTPTLRRFLDGGYRRVGTADGAVLYLRDCPSAAPCRSGTG